MSEGVSIDFVDDVSKSIQTEGKSTKLREIDGDNDRCRDDHRMDRHRDSQMDSQVIDGNMDGQLCGQEIGGNMDSQVDEFLNIPQCLTVGLSNNKKPSALEIRSADNSSMQSGLHQIASFHQDANRAETREHKAPKMILDISSEKPDIDKITYSKLSGRS